MIFSAVFTFLFYGSNVAAEKISDLEIEMANCNAVLMISQQ